MVNQLVPKFILNQMNLGRLSGNFQAVCLLVDISGFTPLATALMEDSTAGSEVVAEALGAIFKPLIDIVFAHGGMVASFVGDGFTALFPTDPTTPLKMESAYLCATLAAWQSSQFVANHADRITRFGSFSFAVKISIADGWVDWGIWQSAEEQEQKEWQQHAAYFFTGEAFDRCFSADLVAPAGGILLTEAVYAQLPPKAVTVRPVSSYWQLLALDDSLINRRSPIEAMTVPPNGISQPLISRFFPLWLLQRPIIGEFRQIVAMFINLAAFPTEQENKQFQHTFFRLLAQYGGYLCSIGRISPQDQVCTIILFWGAPLGYENSVSRALHFIWELKRVAPIPIRVGVTYHLTYAGFIGSAQCAEYTCYGAYVTLAARQMTIAHWGEVILDEFSAAQARKDFHLLAYGWRQFKGFMEEHPIYLLDRQRERISDVQDSIPFIGRQRELAQLRTYAQPLFQGKCGGVVIIMGEAGIGKSRLLREFQRTLADLPLSVTDLSDMQAGRQVDTKRISSLLTPTWFYCRTDEILRQPFNPFRYALYHYFNQSSIHGPQQNYQHFTGKLDELIAATADPMLTAELGRLRSVLAALLELPGEDAFYQQLDPELRLENTFEALKTLFKAESCRRPLIIQVEDTHWLDRESRLFLEKLMHNIEGYPLLLLITTRFPNVTEEPKSETNDPSLPAVVPRIVLQLQPLLKTDIRVLAHSWLEGMVTPDLLDLLQDQSKGNPFFAEQILLHWQEQALLQWGDQGWRLQADEGIPYLEDSLSLSPDIRAILTARLDRLPAELKTIVQTASVLGHEFQRPVLDYMLQPTQVAADPITLGEEIGIWRVVAPTAWRFHHSLLCDTAYAMQSRVELQQLHARAAAAIEEIHHIDLQQYYAALVYHYYNADDQEQERRYARLAGISAAEGYRNQEAVSYFDRALALTPPTELAEQYELSVALEAVHKWLGDPVAQCQAILFQRRIAKSARNRQWQAEAALKQAEYERMTGNYEAAVASSQEAIALAETLGHVVVLGQAHYLWGKVLRHQGYHQAAHFQLQQALREARNTRALVLEADCLYETGNLFYIQGSYPEASAYYTQAEAIYQQADHKRGQVNCLLMFGAICYGKGDFAQAEQLYQKALIITRTLGWRPGETSCLGNLGNTYFDVGDYTAAYSYHFQALELCQEIGDREGEAVSWDTLGLIAQRQGDLVAAEGYCTDALKIQQALGDQHGEAYTQTHLGYMLLAQEQIAQAKEHFQSAVQLRTNLGELSAAIDSKAGFAYIQWKEQDLAAALQSIQYILQFLEEKGVDGIEFPVQVYLICYQVLDALAQTQPEHKAAAQTTLDTVYQLVQERAAPIVDPNLRRMFLERVPSNAMVIALWEKRRNGLPL